MQSHYSITLDRGEVSTSNRDFVQSVFDAGVVTRIGTDIGKVLPRMSFFGNTAGGGSRAEVKERVLAKITEFLERYAPLG